MNNNHSSLDSTALCSYINTTSKIQVARITNIPNWYFERVVFPGQTLMFEARLDANLEIHTGMMASSILSDTIPCTKLAIEAEATSQTLSTEQPEKPSAQGAVVAIEESQKSNLAPLTT